MGAARRTGGHRHHHDEHVRDIISVVGGKLTTHRSLAEGAVELIFATLGRQAPDCRTAEEPLPGGRATGRGSPTASWPAAAWPPRSRTTCSASTASGRRPCSTTPRTTTGRGSGCRGTDAIAAEVPFAVRAEFATTLADIFLRRTMTGLGADLGLESLEAVTATARETLGWSEERARAEAADYAAPAARHAGSGLRL